MMNIAYLDCFSGISGDMFLGALLDCGLPLDDLIRLLGNLDLGGYRIDKRSEARKHIYGTRFKVSLEDQTQPPRNLEDIKKIICQGKLSESVRDKSIDVFSALARVEAKVHDLTPENVHFHEVGAVDSIIDIVGTVYGIERLGIKRIYASPLPLGSGLIKSAHGMIPVPSPATIALLKDIPVFASETGSEMVTPTGAALLKVLGHSFGPIPPMVVRQIGYGVGKRDLPDRPNLLRILKGDHAPAQDSDTILMLETNLDDSSPECLGYLMERLFEAGALDVTFFPVQMKKNRPGIQLQVMGYPDQKDVLMNLIFKESTALGVRFRHCQRRILKRSTYEIDSSWGKIKATRVQENDGSFSYRPEYEACKKIAIDHSLPLRNVYAWVNERD